MKWKKIVAVGLLTTLTGGLLLGCTEKVDKSQYDDIAAQAQVLQQQINQIKGQQQQTSSANSELKSQLQETLHALNATKLELTDKEQELLDYERSQAAEEDLEKLAEEDVDDLDFGSEVPETALDEHDLSFLSSGTVEVNDEDYDYEEKIVLTSLRVGVSSEDDQEFDSTPALLFTETESVTYTVEFQDAVPFDEVSDEEPLVLSFLGKELSIVEIDDDEFTYKSASKAFLKEGESRTFGNATVMVNAVMDDEAQITVNGETRVVAEGDTRKIGGVQVRVRDTLYQGYAGGVKYAEVEVGEDVLRTIQSEDEYVKGDDAFEWRMDTDDGSLVSVSVTYDVKADDNEEEVLKPGQYLDFADYFTMGFDFEKQYSYTTYKFSFDEAADDQEPALKVVASEEDGIKVGTEKVDKAYLTADGMVWWKEDGEWVNSEDDLVLFNDETELVVSYDSEMELLSIGDDISLQTNLVSLGAENEAESTDVFVAGQPVGEVEESLLLENGVIVDSVEQNAESDQFEVSVPEEKVQGVLKFRKK